MLYRALESLFNFLESVEPAAVACVAFPAECALAPGGGGEWCFFFRSEEASFLFFLEDLAMLMRSEERHVTLKKLNCALDFKAIIVQHQQSLFCRVTIIDKNISIFFNSNCVIHEYFC